MKRVIVDTSVFVEFFRGRAVPRLAPLLLANAVLLSQFVYLELLQGVRRNEARALDYVLWGIPRVPRQDELFSVAQAMLRRLKGSGLTVGIVDLLIASEAKILGCTVMSFDDLFGRLHRLGLVGVYPPTGVVAK